MKRTRRTYSGDYKLAAVKKIIEQGLSYAEVVQNKGTLYFSLAQISTMSQ